MFDDISLPQYIKIYGDKKNFYFPIKLLLFLEKM